MSMVSINYNNNYPIEAVIKEYNNAYVFNQYIGLYYYLKSNNLLNILIDIYQNYSKKDIIKIIIVANIHKNRINKNNSQVFIKSIFKDQQLLILLDNHLDLLGQIQYCQKHQLNLYNKLIKAKEYTNGKMDQNIADYNNTYIKIQKINQEITNNKHNKLKDIELIEKDLLKVNKDISYKQEIINNRLDKKKYQHEPYDQTSDHKKELLQLLHSFNYDTNQSTLSQISKNMFHYLPQLLYINIVLSCICYEYPNNFNDENKKLLNKSQWHINQIIHIMKSNGFGNLGYEYIDKCINNVSSIQWSSFSNIIENSKKALNNFKSNSFIQNSKNILSKSYQISKTIVNTPYQISKNIISKSYNIISVQNSKLFTPCQIIKAMDSPTRIKILQSVVLNMDLLKSNLNNNKEKKIDFLDIKSIYSLLNNEKTENQLDIVNILSNINKISLKIIEEIDNKNNQIINNINNNKEKLEEKSNNIQAKIKKHYELQDLYKSLKNEQFLLKQYNYCINKFKTEHNKINIAMQHIKNNKKSTGLMTEAMQYLNLEQKKEDIKLKIVLNNNQIINNKSIVFQSQLEVVTQRLKLTQIAFYIILLLKFVYSYLYKKYQIKKNKKY